MHQDEYHSARLPNWLLSIAATRRYFLPSLVEPRTRVSAHSCCLPLHAFLCRLLISPDTEPGARVQVRAVNEPSRSFTVPQKRPPTLRTSNVKHPNAMLCLLAVLKLSFIIVS